MNIQGQSDSDEETRLDKNEEPGPQFGTNLDNIASSMQSGKTQENFASYSDQLVFESDEDDDDDMYSKPKGRKRKRSSSGGEGELDMKSSYF